MTTTKDRFDAPLTLAELAHQRALLRAGQSRLRFVPPLFLDEYLTAEIARLRTTLILPRAE